MPDSDFKYSEFVDKYRAASEKAISGLDIGAVKTLITLLARSRESDRQIFVCGNGGSAAMASHLVGELGKEPLSLDGRRFRVFSLVDNAAWITAIANDESYSEIFVEQLKNLARRDDVLVAFSCSGNSENVITAVEWALGNGVTTVGITGNGGRLAQLADLVVSVPSNFTPHIQEAHMLVQHLISYCFADTEFH